MSWSLREIERKKNIVDQKKNGRNESENVKLKNIQKWWIGDKETIQQVQSLPCRQLTQFERYHPK